MHDWRFSLFGIDIFDAKKMAICRLAEQATLRAVENAKNEALGALGSDTSVTGKQHIIGFLKAASCSTIIPDSSHNPAHDDVQIRSNGGCDARIVWEWNS
jgi:hypothetical protein